MTEGQTGILAAVILILHCVYTYAPRFQINFVLTPFLASWESVFILGYFCTTKTAMQYYRFIMAGAGLSVVFIIYAVQNVSDFSALLYNNAPTMVVIAAAVFLFFRKHGNALFSKDSRLLQTAGKYSFSILLIHWYILFEVVEKVFGLNGQSLGIVGGIVLTAVLTLGASFLFAAVYDNTVVICLNGIIEAAIGIGKTKKQILRRKG